MFTFEQAYNEVAAKLAKIDEFMEVNTPIHDDLNEIAYELEENGMIDDSGFITWEEYRVFTDALDDLGWEIENCREQAYDLDQVIDKLRLAKDANTLDDLIEALNY